MISVSKVDKITLANKTIRHIKKHTYDGMLEQSKYLTDEQLQRKLNNMTFFNKSLTQDEVIENIQTAYDMLKSKGQTGKNVVMIKGESITVIMKSDGTLDTAFGNYKYKVEDFRK